VSAAFELANKARKPLSKPLKEFGKGSQSHMISIRFAVDLSAKALGNQWTKKGIAHANAHRSND